MKKIHLSRLASVCVFATLLTSGLAHADLNVVQIAPLSGPLADTGKLLQQGAEMAFQEANAKGGIGGQKVRLITKDDAYKVDETVRLVKEAGSSADKPVAFLGLVGTGNIAALVEKKTLDEVGIPVVGARSGAGMLRNPSHPLVYHLRASYSAEVEQLVEVASSIGAKNFGVMYQDDPFGQDGLEAMKKAVSKRNLKLLASGAYEKNTTKIDSAVDTLLKASDISAIVLVSNTQATAAFVKAYREKGGVAQLYAVSVNNDREIVARIGEKARGLSIAQVVPFPFSTVLPITKEYQTLLKKYFPDALPTVTGMEGYIYGKVMVEALRRAGPSPNPESLKKALEGAPFELGGFVIDFAPGEHEGSSFVELTIIGRNGALIR
jgi:ABC-type branched-subunit amino acid transport system substrate-binding protein